MVDPLVMVRAVHYAATVLVTGTVIFRFIVAAPLFRVPGDQPPALQSLRRRLLLLIWLGLATALVTGAAWLLLLAADIGGRHWTQAFSEGVAWTVLTQTQFGYAWLARLVIALLLAACLVPSLLSGEGRVRSQDLLSVLLAASFIGALAFAGHSGAGEGPLGGLQLATDALHLVAAGAWVGGLVPLACLFAIVRRIPEQLSADIVRATTLRFSILGTVCVSTLLVTGIISSIFLVGHMSGFTATTYGQLLLIKIAIYAAMVGIAAFNRLRLTPALTPATRPEIRLGALRSLQRNSLIEAALGCSVLILVAALGTLPPAWHHLDHEHRDAMAVEFR